jgi:molybdenum cofactor cytidylyltransferase
MAKLGARDNRLKVISPGTVNGVRIRHFANCCGHPGLVPHGTRLLAREKVASCYFFAAAILGRVSLAPRFAAGRSSRLPHGTRLLAREKVASCYFIDRRSIGTESWAMILLLCAGLSRRMGTPKALLRINGETLVARALRELSGNRILCVTSSDSVESEIRRSGGRFVRNPAPELGLLSSIKSGIRALESAETGVVVSLVDLPFLNSDDYGQLPRGTRLSRFRYQGQPAHPVWIPAKYFAEILDAPEQDFGCGFLFKKYADQVKWLEAKSAAGIQDLDTPEDYHAHISS